MKKMMKQWIPVLACAWLLLAAAPGAQAQDEGALDEVPQDPRAQEKIQNLRIAYITDKLGLTPAQAEKFWPVYREYAEKRREVRQQLIDARKGLDAANPDPDQQKRVLDLGLRVKQQELDLERDYSDRILKVISAQQMLALRKAEGDFNKLILNQIQQRRLMQQRRENVQQRQRLRQRN
ncbi:MAG: hypothetical protein MUC38_07030 [Cyclobacteriaceae bacterium]|jgi:hypothetical protein|nr:hypothetical protein [Cyclobacteriaceae bacterium]